MKVLFLVPYPTEGPSNRYRVEQYLPYLKTQGIDYCIRPFMSSDFFKIMYKRGRHFKKIFLLLGSTAKRLSDLVRYNKYDLVFVHIESFPFGPAICEWFFSKLGKPIIYDFEDAVYLPNFKGNNKVMNTLRHPGKFYQILRLSDHVIVCNRYMRDFVYSFNRNVTVIPTSIDTGKFKLKDVNSQNKTPIIGWIGSHTTSYCLNQLINVFIKLAEKFDFSLKIIGGEENFNIPGVNVINEKWTLQKDIENFQSLDIGIYPLPNDERALAKTPFKTIQYMSVGVPVMASRVGGNIEIIQDGINGFLAATENEWLEKLTSLIQDINLRKKMGLAGRKTVEERYSLERNAPYFVEILKKAYKDNF
ncbi:MAG: glycosyltransferase family 4 protein [Candidatus Omnitrophica bacterium]|nr:glycosyltransferase family 4 protein [Candidatus Omnitrophota bacterium]